MSAIIATDHVSNFTASLAVLSFSNLIDVGSKIFNSSSSDALRSTSVTFCRSYSSLFTSTLSCFRSDPRVVTFMLCVSWMSLIRASISIDKSGVDNNGFIVSSVIVVYGLCITS